MLSSTPVYVCMYVCTYVCMYVSIHPPYRLIVGAPAGTYPGGLTGLEPRAPETLTGLVYQCPVSAGDCTGVISNVSNVTSNDRRLFDGDRKLFQ